MRISIIVAVAENGVIGRDGDLPWRLSSDLQRFKRITMGHHLVMGRKTYESIGRPLPGRTSVLLTRQADYRCHEEVDVVGSWEEAIAACKGDDEVFVIGGEQVYLQALPHADRVYLTEVHGEPEGDARFPQLDAAEWLERERQIFPSDSKNEVASTFRILDRVGRLQDGSCSDLEGGA